jgi:hypothetical protein
VAAVNETDTVTYDYHDRAYNFCIVYSPQRLGYGLVQLQGEWQVEKSADAPDQTIPDSAIPDSTVNLTHSLWTKA